MPLDARTTKDWKRASWAVTMATAGALLSGCAAGPGQSWADFKSRRAIDKIASDDSFPSAAEVGLTASNDADTVSR